MALSEASLSGKLKTAISAVLDVSDDAQLTAICDAIAGAVVEEINDNAVVDPDTMTGYSGFAIQGTGKIL